MGRSFAMAVGRALDRPALHDLLSQIQHQNYNNEKIEMLMQIVAQCHI
jgi:hypothetical protein